MMRRWQNGNAEVTQNSEMCAIGISSPKPASTFNIINHIIVQDAIAIIVREQTELSLECWRYDTAGYLDDVLVGCAGETDERKNTRPLPNSSPKLGRAGVPYKFVYRSFV